MKKEVSTRQLKVGEQIKHILSDIFLKNDFHSIALSKTTISVSEVRISPDFRNASVYVLSLSNDNLENIISELNLLSPQIRKLLSQEVTIKFLPVLHFIKDQAFFEATKIDQILKSGQVAKDLIDDQSAQKKSTTS